MEFTENCHEACSNLAKFADLATAAATLSASDLAVIGCRRLESGTQKHFSITEDIVSARSKAEKIVAEFYKQGEGNKDLNQMIE